MEMIYNVVLFIAFMPFYLLLRTVLSYKPNVISTEADDPAPVPNTLDNEFARRSLLRLINDWISLEHDVMNVDHSNPQQLHQWRKSKFKLLERSERVRSKYHE